MITARNPQQEATDLLDDGWVARVLEPSPPAVDDGEFFADDPVSRSDVPLGTRVVSPVPGGDMTWRDWVADHPEHEDEIQDGWLGSYRRIGYPPDAYTRTRATLHGLATNVMTPARYRANGKIGLRWTRDGFGTPFFGDDKQVRVERTAFVVQHGDHVHAGSLSTLGAAAQLALGQDAGDLQWAADLKLHDVPAELAPDTPVEVDPDAAAYLADWFGFAFATLELLRAEGASVDASRPQLWPEHFDPAIEVLPEKRRASYGFSPGDADHAAPYVYVSVWYPDDLGGLDGELWNAQAFPGAELPLEAFVDEDDQIGFVLGWLRERRDALAERTPA